LPSKDESFGVRAVARELSAERFEHDCWLVSGEIFSHEADAPFRLVSLRAAGAPNPQTPDLPISCERFRASLSGAGKAVTRSAYRDGTNRKPQPNSQQLTWRSPVQARGHHTGTVTTGARSTVTTAR
jgi:hypothetical protein